MSAAMIWVNILLGLACIVIGGQLAVNGATGIARMFGLSETLIGLTIVAMAPACPSLSLPSWLHARDRTTLQWAMLSAQTCLIFS